MKLLNRQIIFILTKKYKPSEKMLFIYYKFTRQNFHL